MAALGSVVSKPESKKKKKAAPRYFDNDNNHNEEVVEYIMPEQSVIRKAKIKENSIKQRKQHRDDRQTNEWKEKRRKIFNKRNNEDTPTEIIRKVDPYPGDAPIPEEKIEKYKRGDIVKEYVMKTKFQSYKFQEREEKYEKSNKQSARLELIQDASGGYLEADEGEKTSEVTQYDISKVVDITSASKFFELDLKHFGPYRLNYTKNGRQLLIGGAKGHVAAFDWQTKKLMCEINVMETVNDVKWLHTENMFAAAQRRWTYIYDNQGIELHCLKMLDCVVRMEFLPYHFLLATSSAKGYLNYLDVSVGQNVRGHQTGLGRMDVMCQNPSNAIIHLGHSGGTVTLWSPNVKEPLVKMLCHGSGTRAIAVDNKGMYMATSGIDRTIKIWDLRMYKALQCYKVGAGPGHLSFSQTGALSAAIGSVVQVYKDCCQQTMSEVYMSHQARTTISGLQFCPYEDVLGVTHGIGFASLLIPGSGEVNFDALESNPYRTKKQRQQAEVKMLLEKIQPEMINLDTSKLGKIDVKSLQEEIEERNKILFLKPEKIEFEPRYKKKGRSKAGKVESRKRGVQEEHSRDVIKEIVAKRQEEMKDKLVSSKPRTVLDRFKKKSD